MILTKTVAIGLTGRCVESLPNRLLVTVNHFRVGHERLYALCLDVLGVPAFLPEDLNFRCGS